MKEMTKKVGGIMQGNTLSQANEALIQEYLDIVANDSENLDRTMALMADDCVWVMEPTGDTYRGREEIEAFVGTAMAGRTHQAQYGIQVSNWFTDGEYLCIEYTHGAILTGRYSVGIKAKIKKGIARYCITYHMRDGKFDWAHEYIQGTTFLANFAMPLMLKRMKRLVEKKCLGGKLQAQKRTVRNHRRKAAMNEQHIVKPSMKPVNQRRPLGIIVAAVFTVIAGLAEVVTGFTHNFFGITTSSVAVFTYSSAVIGLFYVAAGLLILTMRRGAAVLALVLLGADIVGRLVLVFTGLYPTSSLKNTLSIIAGTVLVALVALYIGWKWKFFR